MTENSTSAAIRAAMNSSGDAHIAATEMLDAIAQIAELQLRHDHAAFADKTMANTTIETIKDMAASAKRDVMEADQQLCRMFDQVEELEKALPAPLPAGIPTVAQVRTEDFAAAFVTYEQAKAAMDQFHADHVKPVSDQHSAAQGAAKDALAEQVDAADAAFADYVDRQGKAIVALFKTPSPDLAAHAMKLRVWISEQYQDMNDAPEMMKAIAADAERLAQQGEA